MTTDTAASETEAKDPVSETDSAQENVSPELTEANAKIGKLEQDIASMRGRVRQANVSAEAISESEERTSGVFRSVIQTILEVDDPEERKQRVGQAFAEQQRQSALAKDITATQPRLQKIVDDSGLNWTSDEVFEDARRSWDAGSPAEALALARLAIAERNNGAGALNPNSDKFKEAVRTEVRNERTREANQVETGSSSAGGAGGEEARSLAHMAQIMSAARTSGQPKTAEWQRNQIQRLGGSIIKR
jgi:hypothetical protein